MNSKKHTIMTFADVPMDGTLFRGLRPDRIRDREVASDGLYVKVGATIAVDIAHGNTDCILSLKLPCRILPKKWDVTQLETWKVTHRGEPHAHK